MRVTLTSSLARFCLVSGLKRMLISWAEDVITCASTPLPGPGPSCNIVELTGL
jgi:hypothetical protein